MRKPPAAQHQARHAPNKNISGKRCRMHNFSVLMPGKKSNGDGLMNALQAGACACAFKPPPETQAAGQEI